MELQKKSPVERVRLARSKDRPTALDYMENLIDDLMIFAGDRCYGEDPAISGGIGFFHDIPVTVIGHIKGRDLEENISRRFGMPDPEGYRKAERLMLQAAKFRRPVITFVDTPGAYPGKEAEERGQGQAIAECIKTMSRLPVPTIAAFTGEGGSGGALALAVSDRLIMLENSIFSILSPEGFASILWHDSGRWEEACESMKLTSVDLYELGVCDEIVPEPSFEAESARDTSGNGEHNSNGDPSGNGEISDRQYLKIYKSLDDAVWRNLRPLLTMSGEELVRERYLKLRKSGSKNGRN